MMFEDAMEGLGAHQKQAPTSVGEFSGVIIRKHSKLTATATPITYQDATDDGFRALWVVFIIMVLTTISFASLSWSIPVSRRLYHILTTLVTLTAALSYFAMATGHATTYHCTSITEHHKHKTPTHYDLCRQIFWARYVDWSITTPLILLDLALLAGMDGAHTFMAVTAAIIMTLSGLFAAFGRAHTVQRWGWYTIACISYLFVIWHIAVNGTKAVKAKSDRVNKLFGCLTAYTLILWVIYPM